MKLRVLLFFLLGSHLALAADRPNILWLSIEDYGPHFGCYGDEYADTPNVDAFAERSLLYLNASSNAPVCAPARTTIVTGVFPTMLGAQHMRSEAKVPDWLTLSPMQMAELGYRCYNPGKTDYNLAVNDKGQWNGKGEIFAKNEKPFYAVLNYTGSHESQIRNANPNPQHDPAKAPVPAYMPDTPEVRKDWAQYYDRGTQADKWLADQLEKLEKSGLAEDTIVWFWGDHGSGMPRSKRYVGWSGLHVPLIVHIPEKFKHLRPADYLPGAKTERLVGFVDFAPTLLSLAGKPAVDYHHGTAFLGEHIGEAPEFSFGFRDRMDERPDSSRSVTDGRYIYIKNFMPHLPLLKGLRYQMETPTTRVWKEMFEKGELNETQAFAWTAPRPNEELYDLKNDPDETVNLADKNSEVLEKFRSALVDHLNRTGDLGLLSEALMHEMASDFPTPGDFAKSDPFEVKRKEGAFYLEPKKEDKRLAANHASLPVPPFDEETLKELESWLEGDSPVMKVAALDLLVREKATPERADRLLALADPAETGPYTALQALGALSQFEELSPEQVKTLKNLNTKPNNAPSRVKEYCQRLKETLLEKFSK